MLATALALQLLLGQADAAPAPAAPPPGDEEALKADRELPPPPAMPARDAPRSAIRPIPSLLSAEPLGGTSAVAAWAGWSSVGAGWAQGITAEDDLGAVADLDWSTGELRLEGFYRRPLGRVGAFDIASRLRAGWYADLGAQWFRDENRANRGVGFVPGIVVSTRSAGGVFSLGGDLPIVVTLWREGGIFAAPKASFSYETTLYGDLSVGVRFGAAWRAGTDHAPMPDPHALIEMQVLAGWRLL